MLDLENGYDAKAKRLPLQLLTALFLVTVCLSMVALTAWQVWNSRSVQISEGEVMTSNLAKSLAQHAQDTFTEADTVLIGLQERMEIDGASPQHLARMSSLLKRHVQALPQLEGLFVYDDKGGWLATSFATIPSNINNADRAYFKHHLSSIDLNVHISHAVRSRSTNNWIIPVSRRFNKPDGSFGGVVLATIRMSYFQQFYDSFQLGEEGAIFLALSDGSIIARRPFKDEYMNKSLQQGSIFSNYLPSSPTGIAVVRALVDNVERMYGYRQLEQYPLVIGAALSKKTILSHWTDETRRAVAMVALMLLGMTMFGLLLLRQIQHGMQAEAGLVDAKRGLEKLAMYDGLTGLANRRYLDTLLPAELGRALRYSHPVGLIMIDIDYFKAYNDLFGHPGGDDCLQKVAKAIQKSLNRPSDVAIRYGGEEISVLLPGSDLDGSVLVAERIRVNVRELKLVHPGNPTGYVTVSCGVHAYVPDRGDECSGKKLIMNADQALYRAKRDGRNQVQANREPSHHG
jgi:diguanylate cyclase (GGDEF)-like protein